ncbi:zinc-ribbon domain-containing protein [Oceanobacillus sp. FSL K6-2867]|uniref:zinc-ribbon domain-containing protein n=1 Tax=Oceanobacillus sp. FSL K6-2867 TaxID=2954748 RepID=UPI0030DA711A
MFHCPNCGTTVKEKEQYCIKCGKPLPKDIESRIFNKRKFNKFWLVPIIAVLLIASLAGVYHLILKSQTAEAKEFYAQGEQQFIEGNYEKAQKLFTKSIDSHPNFKQAKTALAFSDLALQIEDSLSNAKQLQEESSFQKASSVVHDASQLLNNYKGTAVDQMINQIETVRNHLKIAELTHHLEQDPGIDDLKVMLWDAEAINQNDARELTQTIRDQIIDYSFTKASEQLNQKQFSDALLLVKDGLKYAPDSEKLDSLQITIEKEKAAFETAMEQRIEQAMNSAAQENELNENDAIELAAASIKKDKQENIFVEGEVKSVATIPVHSVVVEYTISTKNGSEILTNEVVTFPDVLYPGETGKFEFTHYDLDKKPSSLEIKVTKITWYTE